MNTEWFSPKSFVPYILLSVGILLAVVLGFSAGYRTGFNKGVKTMTNNQNLVPPINNGDGINPGINPVETICTMDAKICSDGSAVGRIPPSCEFAACPGE